MLGHEVAVELRDSHGELGSKESWVQIIFIPHRMAKARTISVSARHLCYAAALGLALVTSMTAGMYWLTMRYATEMRVPFVRQLVAAAQQSEADKAREFVQQNLNAMAVKLGEMEAQLTRLDALGERVSHLAGFNPQEFRFWQAPGLGGAAPTLMPPQNLSLAEFRDKVFDVSQEVESRTDALGVLEAQLFDQAVKKRLLPTMAPVSAPISAGYGKRIDPFTGQIAMHEGIDFLADVGTPVLAAAAGVVVYAGYHPQYGNMVDIDHGNDLITRYAHMSKLYVKDGDLVARGRKIGLSGSTGRSTGPHLHFEVRYKGVAQNPARFLFASKGGSPVSQAGTIDRLLASKK